MATVDQVIDNVNRLLGYPSWDTLSLSTRLGFVQDAVAGLMNELSLNRIPDIVSSVQKTITGATPVSLPTDFGQAFLVTTDPASYVGETVYEIPITTMLDRGHFVDKAAFKTGLAGVEIRNVGTSRRLVAYPLDAASTDLVVWYKPVASALDMTSEIPIHEAFHLTLLPVRVARRMVAYARWDEVEDQAAKRVELKQNLIEMEAEELISFKQLVQRINPGGPKRELVGFGAARNQRRFGSY